MDSQAERRIGTIVNGKWRIDALLGSGSMASVYGATHRNGVRAAIKMLHPTLCVDPAVCERFLGEGYLANSIQHRGVVRVLDDGVTDDGCVFLVMDLLEGETLEQRRLRRGNKLPLVEVLGIGDQLLDVLGAVHGAGVIHRDLKPQNVFVTNQREIRLLDFGVARVFDRQSSSKLSVFGLVLGTPSFMPPEQALGNRDKVDERSDIWALAATLFTCLSGEHVHTGPNVQAKLLAAATVRPRSLASVAPDVPKPIVDVVDQGLQFKKEDRWATCGAMRTALQQASARLGLVASFPLAQSTTVPMSERALPAAAPAAVAAPGSGLGVGMSFDDRTTVDNPGQPPAPRAPGTVPPGEHGPDGTLIGMPKEFIEVKGPPPVPGRTDPPKPGAPVADVAAKGETAKTVRLGSAPVSLPPAPSGAASHVPSGPPQPIVAPTGVRPPWPSTMGAGAPAAQAWDTVGGASATYEGLPKNRLAGPVLGGVVALVVVVAAGLAVRKVTAGDAVSDDPPPADSALTVPAPVPSLSGGAPTLPSPSPVTPVSTAGKTTPEPARPRTGAVTPPAPAPSPPSTPQVVPTPPTPPTAEPQPARPTATLFPPVDDPPKSPDPAPAPTAKPDPFGTME